MQPLLIGPSDAGVQNNLKPFMIPENAFPDMLNAFVWRNRIQRKAGYALLGRLQQTITGQSLGNTDGAGNLSVNILTFVTAIDAGGTIAPGSITITVTGVPNQVFTEPATPNGTLVGAPGSGTGTINYATGAVTISTNPALAGAATTITFGYYTNLPVMGIRTREIPQTGDNYKTIFFDIKYAYQFISGFSPLPSVLPTIWHGTDDQQFWSTNYQVDALNQPYFWVTNNVPGLNNYTLTTVAAAAGATGAWTATITTGTPNNFQLNDQVVFVNPSGGFNNTVNIVNSTVTSTGTSFNVLNTSIANPFTNAAGLTGFVIANRLIAQNVAGQDGIRLYSGPSGATWLNLDPSVNSLTILAGGLLLVPYHARMVVLNTWEGNNTSAPIQFAQRARWCQIGNATDLALGWRDDIVGRGGFEDAATEEAIISCGFVKDELIVYFERSTWKLAYTGNEIGPFIWQRISSELGAESTFSSVQFDKGLLAVGNVGVHQCNGSNVERIDSVIPDEVFDIHNGSDGPLRVSGIRDFFQEIVYFAYPNAQNNAQNDITKVFFPNKMMIFNYVNNTFSFFDDNATTFGYFQKVTDTPWSQLNTFTWEAWNIQWNSGIIKQGFPSVNFGNQQGFVETIDPDLSSNGPSLAISNISGNQITSPQHNLFVGQYVRLTNVLGMTLKNLSGVVVDTFQVTTIVDANNFTIDGTSTGTYLGAGLITVLTNINIPTKQFTPFWTQGKNYSLKYVDVLVDKTAFGELNVGVFIDFNTTDSMSDTTSGSILGSSTLSTAAENTNLPYYSFQNQSTQIWKRFYTFATGETFQIAFSFNDAEMRTQNIRDTDVVIHAMIFHFDPAGDFY